MDLEGCSRMFFETSHREGYVPLASFIHSRYLSVCSSIKHDHPGLSAILAALVKSHRERRLDKLGRLLPLTLDVADKRCDDIASSV